jgi:AAA+ ATPase superfamily predicted ATPase
VTAIDFVNRSDELAALERWWGQPRASVGLVWGRRRVGKTALLQRFVGDKRAIFHTAAGRPVTDELGLLSRSSVDLVGDEFRDLGARPFTDWDDAFDVLARAAAADPLLLVLDEFPEMVHVLPELPNLLRAFLERAKGRTKLRVLLCGSAVRTMQAIQEERAPLYGRLSLVLQVLPFRPHEVAEMLPKLTPGDRAVVWGIVGGVPLYLSWWDQSESIRENLARLVCTPGGLLLNEGQLVLATEVEAGELPALVLRAIGAGRTKHGEIADAVRAEPTRTLERLIELRLVERVTPVTEDPRRSRRRIYRIADNFIAFWLGAVDRHRAEIERGLGRGILSSLMEELDDRMGRAWEEAFRMHLRRLAAVGQIAPDVVAIGAWWQESGQGELDAVVLAGRRREAVLVGEAKWTRRVEAPAMERALMRKLEALPSKREPVRLAIGAREEVHRPGDGTLVVTAHDVFSRAGQAGS